MIYLIFPISRLDSISFGLFWPTPAIASGVLGKDKQAARLTVVMRRMALEGVDPPEACVAFDGGGGPVRAKLAQLRHLLQPQRAAHRLVVLTLQMYNAKELHTFVSSNLARSKGGMEERSKGGKERSPPT